MEQQCDKIYQELLAMICIREHWSGYRDGYVKSESPDWVNHSEGVGIEVRQAITDRQGFLRSFAKKYLGLRSERIPQKELSNTGCDFGWKNGRLAWMIPADDKGPGEVIEAAYRGYLEKLKLLNSPHFTKYGTNCLALMLPVCPGDSGIDRFIDAASIRRHPKSFKTKFDFVFLLCGDFYCIDCENWSVTRKNLKPTEWNDITLSVDRMRRSSSWLSGTAFV